MFTDEENPGLARLKAWADKRLEFWADPPRGQCGEEGCDEKHAILFTGSDDVQRCAHHHTRTLNRKHEYPCDNCGKGPAFRDPATRRDEMLCPSCHEKDGYVPGERSMLSKVAARVGYTHSRGRKEVCLAAGKGTDCKGEVKPRGKLGLLCAFHFDPVKYTKAKGA